MTSSNEREPTGNPLTSIGMSELLASVIDTLQEAVVTINLDETITSWNRAAEQIYGRRAEEVVGRSVHAVLVEDSFQQLLTNIRKMVRGQDVGAQEIIRSYRDGHVLYLDNTLSPITNQQGVVIGVTVLCRGGQKYQSAQETPAASENNLRAILEAAVDFGIITLDEHGSILDWNSGAQNIFGYRKEEVQGRHTGMLFTPEDRHAGIPQVEIETAKNTGRSIDERWHLHKDGSRFFMSGVMTPTINNGARCYVKVARNITDRKLAEEALLMSEQRKSLAIQSAEMGEWEWELATDIVKISHQVSVLLGLPADRHEVSPAEMARLVYPDDAPPVREQLDKALSGFNIFQTECRIVRADNQQVVWVNVYGRVVAHAEEKPSKMIGVFYDITPRKLLEKQKDDFIGMASHELKTPTTAIKAYIDLLKESLEESAADGSLLLLNKLNGQVDRLIALMQNLLDSTSLSEGRLKLHPQTFDLTAALQEHRETLKTLAARHRISWQIASIPLIHADKDRIMQVVDNFVGNAAKYSAEGTEIIVTARDQATEVFVSVQDEGIGIPEDARRFVFERYYRGEHEAGSKGFGLGLYICAQIIKEHNGAIGLSSQPGKGSTFYFTLPYT